VTGWRREVRCQAAAPWKQPGYNPQGFEPDQVLFDPLGFANFQGEYVDDVLESFNVGFNRLRWYREAELMHGRVAMLATIVLLLEGTVLDNAMPNSAFDQSVGARLLQLMTGLEAFRGWKMLSDQVAGDTAAWDSGRTEELAERQYRELENGRLAMLAFVGLLAQERFTGQAVGLSSEQLSQLTVTIGSQPMEDLSMVNAILSFCTAVAAMDGVRRIATPQDAGASSMASKAINVSRLQFGTQDPEVPLPAGIVAGQLPQKLQLTEEQVKQFEEDGVIMIKGGMNDWVEFLQKVTEHQIDNPHAWSLVGRMSGLYDYIQRNTWMTNDGYRDFLYYSALGHCLAQLGRTEEIRVSTDMLLCNPNKGFGWHQDNQNGPIDFPDAMRWWVAMDRCGMQDYGAPEYLLGSHKNTSVSDKAVFVSLQDGDLSSFERRSKFVPEPGDLIIWDARTIHRIVAPPGQSWGEGMQRRAIGGTVAKQGAIYLNKGGASAISDLAGHNQENGELLNGPYFPRIYPTRVPEEEELRAKGGIVGRDPKKIVNMVANLVGNATKYASFTKVVGNSKDKKVSN
jgi:hypothetical protein